MASKELHHDLVPGGAAPHNVLATCEIVKFKPIVFIKNLKSPLDNISLFLGETLQVKAAA